MTETEATSTSEPESFADEEPARLFNRTSIGRRMTMGVLERMGSIRNSFTVDEETLTKDFTEGITEWENGIGVIESILMPEGAARQHLTPGQVKGLEGVKNILLGGKSIDHRLHLPKGLLGDAEMGGTSDYILSQFGGMKRHDAKNRVRQVIFANRFIKKLQIKASASDGTKTTRDSFVLPEWSRLSREAQTKLANLLSWENIKSWSFDIFEVDRLCEGQPLLFVGWALLASPYSQHVMQQALVEEGSTEQSPQLQDMPGYGFVDMFKVPQACFISFLRSVETDYQSENPYHNNIHAADVVQSLHAMFHGMDVKSIASTDLELFSLLIAAAVHDVGHPGKNNAFQVNSHSDLAIEYNDASVLENMHASLAFRRIMGASKDEKLNIFQGMSAEQFNTCRKQIIDAVLDTDMTRHFSSVNRIKAIRLANKESSPLNADEAWQVLHFALHMADISNPAKPQPIAVPWTDRCLDEFFQQGDAEKLRGLPVTPLCDRDTTKRAESQIGFIKFVVYPAFEVLGNIVPEVAKVVLPILDENLEYWQGQQSPAPRISQATTASEEKTEKPVAGETKNGEVALTSEDAEADSEKAEEHPAKVDLERAEGQPTEAASDSIAGLSPRSGRRLIGRLFGKRKGRNIGTQPEKADETTD